MRRGTGLAHMEANYGSFFPTSWIWSQTIGNDNGVRLLLTGGKFLIGPIVTDSYIIAFRDPERSWNFHTTLHTDVVNVNFDACAGTLSLVAHHRFSFSSSELRVNISADPTSFSDPLYFPQRSVGFTNKPGCVESYRATVNIEVVENNVTTKTYEIKQGALEFGGEYRCH